MGYKACRMISPETRTIIYTDRIVTHLEFEQKYYSFKTDLFVFNARGCISFEYPYKRVLIKGRLSETRYKHKRPYNIELAQAWKCLEGQAPKDE